MKFYKKIIVKLCLLLVGLAFSFCFAELFFRLLPKYRAKYDFSQFITEDPNLFYLNLDYHHYRPSVLLGYEMIPNTAPGDKSYKVNSYGMVGEEYGLEKNENTFRILVLGDSITRDSWYVEDLKKKLNHNSSPRYNF